MTKPESEDVCRAPLPGTATPGLAKGDIMTQPYVDPIARAWRYCNPQAPLPFALVQRAAPSGFRLSVYTPNGELVAEWLWPKEEPFDQANALIEKVFGTVSVTAARAARSSSRHSLASSAGR